MNKFFLKLLAFYAFTPICNTVYSQEIQGVVLNEKSKPLENVIIFKDEKSISSTNAKGVFVLPKTLKLPIKLKLSYSTYSAKEVNFIKNQDTFYLISRQPDSLLLKNENLKEVVISTTRSINETSEAQLIIPTTTLTAAKLNEYSPIDLVSAINETAGVYIQSGAINTNRIVIRGVGSRTPYGSNKIRAYFNGIPITNGAGETAIDIYDPENLESIEIVKGPKATLFGTNLGGTILINAKDIEPGKTSLKSNFTAGSFGLLKNTATFSTANKNLSLNVAYDHLETDGFRENSKYDRKTLLTTSTYTFDDTNKIDILLHYIDYFAQIPSSIDKTAFDNDPTQAAFTWLKSQGFEDNKQTLAGLSYTHRFSEDLSNKSSIFYTYLDHYEPRPFNILDEYTNGFGARTLFRKQFNFKSKLAELSFGGEFYKDNYNWKTIENKYRENDGKGSLAGELLSVNSEKRDNLNVFAQLTLPLTEKLKAQIGINFNKTAYDFTDKFNTGVHSKTAKRNFDPIIAPSLSFVYQVHVALNTFGTISRGFNFPSIEETLTPNGVINPELGPEKGFNYELGSELFLFQRKFHLQIATYILSIDDLLVAERVGEDQYIGKNAGKTNHKGVEISAIHKFISKPNISISPYFNLEFNNHKFIEFIDEDSNFSGKQLTGVPNTKINAGVNIGYKHFFLNSNFLHIGKIPLNDENLLFTNKYTVLNGKISYKNSLSKILSFELTAGVNNFNNEKYASSVLINAVGFGNSEPRYYYPAMPRNYYGGFKLSGSF